MSECGGEERGAAALLVLSMTGVLLLVTGALGVAGAMFVDHRRAQAAADLAALAGASAAARGEPECAVAVEVAERNGAHLEGCSVAGQAVTVTVTVPGPGWLGQHGDLEASARAGATHAHKGAPPPWSPKDILDFRALPGETLDANK